MKKEIKSPEKEIYISPDIEVMEIEIEQNILQDPSAITNDAPEFDYEDW